MRASGGFTHPPQRVLSSQMAIARLKSGDVVAALPSCLRQRPQLWRQLPQPERLAGRHGELNRILAFDPAVRNSHY